MLRNREIMKTLMPEYHVTMNKSNGETAYCRKMLTTECQGDRTVWYSEAK